MGRSWATGAHDCVPLASRKTLKSVDTKMSPVSASSTASFTGWSPMSYEMSFHVALFVAGSYDDVEDVSRQRRAS